MRISQLRHRKAVIFLFCSYLHTQSNILCIYFNRLLLFFIFFGFGGITIDLFQSSELFFLFCLKTVFFVNYFSSIRFFVG